MAGTLVPVVMFPRYSSFAGRNLYTTIPIDVTDYSRAILTCWRGPLKEPVDAGMSFGCEESSDQETWVGCAGTNTSFDPGDGTEGVADATLKRRWFRLVLNLSSDAPHQNLLDVTCWAVGHLERREP
jgi:hypothetical protein